MEGEHHVDLAEAVAEEEVGVGLGVAVGGILRNGTENAFSRYMRRVPPIVEKKI